MAKKTEDIETITETSKISPLTNRFQTEDLNVLIDKINEIIEKING